MIYTPMTKLALKLCFQAHRDQVDKAGMPYVFHPFHLAEQMPDEDTTIVALLHDVIEDTSCTLSDIQRMGFGARVTDALRLMTHDPATPYFDYVLEIRKNPIARAVKLADLRHNSDVTRLDTVTPKDQKRLLKYRIAESLLADDPYDVSCRHYCKRIPLDNNRLYFLSVFHTGKEVLKYSFDIEAASDAHFEFDPAAAGQLMQLFPGASILPQALADYLDNHDEHDLARLFSTNRIPYRIFHFD